MVNGEPPVIFWVRCPLTGYVDCTHDWPVHWSKVWPTQ